MFKKIKQNGKRLIIIGDVHGCFTKLMDALMSVEYSPVLDLLVFTGDFIDRGPENAAVLEWVSLLLREGKAYAVLGNHDDFMVEWADAYINTQKDPDNFMPLKPEYHTNWMRNGGTWAVDMSTNWILSHALWMRQLPLMLEVELDSGQRAGVVHAELWHDWNTTKDILQHNGVRERLIWGRTKIQQYTAGHSSITSGIDMLFCGHSVVNTPTKVGNQYYLDTGAVFDTLYNSDVKGAFSFAIIKPSSTKPELVKCLK